MTIIFPSPTMASSTVLFLKHGPVLGYVTLSSTFWLMFFVKPFDSSHESLHRLNVRLSLRNRVSSIFSLKSLGLFTNPWS